MKFVEFGNFVVDLEDVRCFAKKEDVIKLMYKDNTYITLEGIDIEEFKTKFFRAQKQGFWSRLFGRKK